MLFQANTPYLFWSLKFKGSNDYLHWTSCQLHEDRSYICSVLCFIFITHYGAWYPIPIWRMFAELVNGSLLYGQVKELLTVRLLMRGYWSTCPQVPCSFYHLSGYLKRGSRWTCVDKTKNEGLPWHSAVTLQTWSPRGARGRHLDDASLSTRHSGCMDSPSSETRPASPSLCLGMHCAHHLECPSCPSLSSYMANSSSEITSHQDFPLLSPLPPKSGLTVTIHST